MSGDAMGYILGAGAVLALAPAVVTVAAVGAAGYGAVKLASAGIRYHRAHAEQAIAVRSLPRAQACAPQLDQVMSRQVEELRSLQAEQQQQISRTLSRAREAVALPVEKLKGPRLEEARRAMRELRREMDQSLAGRQEEITRKALEQASALLEQQQKAVAGALADMEAAEDKGERSRMTEALMQDAEAACQALARLQEATLDQMAAAQLPLIRSRIDAMRAHASQGLDQLACADAAMIINTSSRLLVQARIRASELSARREWLSARVEAVQEELDHACRVTFVTPDGLCHREELDNYDKRIPQLRKQLSDMALQVSGADQARLEALDRELARAHCGMEPILEAAVAHLNKFYSRIGLMERIHEFAAGNNYTLEWVRSQSDAASPLAAHFVHNVTGNDFTIQLGEEDDDGAIPMDLSMFFAQGHPFSNPQVEAFRQNLCSSLAKDGQLSATLCCSGSRGRSSSREELRQATSYQQTNKT